MRRVFSDANRVQKYLGFEAALARVESRLGIIPQEAAQEIVHHCGVGEFDFVKLKTATERIGYPVLPVVQQLVALCRGGLGEWCHWGATRSPNIWTGPRWNGCASRRATSANPA